MFSLPRGARSGYTNVRLASADWGQFSDALRLPYQAGGIFLGGYPYDEAWKPLTAFRNDAVELLKKLYTADKLDPVERARRIDQLDALWLQAMRADCMPLGMTDDRHLVTIAGARSGKGQSAIIPNLCLYPGSVVCLDPKGENASITAARRGQGDEWCKGLGQEVFVLDPFEAADVPPELRASLNPLSLLDPKAKSIVDDAALLAEGLIVPSGGDESHWTDTARNFVRGVVLHLLDTRPGATLFDLRAMLTIGDSKGYADAQIRRQEIEQALLDDPDIKPKPEEVLPDNVTSAFSYLLWSMSRSKAFDGIVAGAGESILGTGDNERGSILSTARRNTGFLDSVDDDYKDCLRGTYRPFNPDKLKSAEKGVTVYLCLPAERMETHGRWLRLLVAQFLQRIQRQLEPPKSGVSVLFLLEEFFALGTMSSIEKAAGYAAGFGLKLWIILQDLQQLKSLYRNSWQTFLANAGAVQIFGASDRETLEYASTAMGECEVVRVTGTVTSNTATGENTESDVKRFQGITGEQGWMRLMFSDKSSSANASVSESRNVGLHLIPLLRPDEIAQHFSRESGAMLLLVKGRRPMWVLRMNYNETPWLRGMFTPLKHWQKLHQREAKPHPFGERQTKALQAVKAAQASLKP